MYDADSTEKEVKCGFCGNEFSPSDVAHSCQACPMNSHCGKIKCPNCGFEVPIMPPTPWIVRMYRKLKERIVS